MSSRPTSPSTLSGYLSNHPDFQSPNSPSSPLPSLYSDLSRQKRSNPSGYRANVEWWKNILTQVVANGVQRGKDVTVATGDDRSATSYREISAPSSSSPSSSDSTSDRLVLHVDESMRQNWTVDQVGRPLGLGTVILELSQSSHLIPVSKFLSSTKVISGPSSSHSSWIPTPTSIASLILVKPLSWGLSQLGLNSDQSPSYDQDEDELSWKKSKGDWVVWENLENLANGILEKHYENPRLSSLDDLFTIRSFRKQFLKNVKIGAAEWNGGDGKELKLSELDLKILLKYLSRDRGIALVEKDIIKFSTSESVPPEPVTDQDREILQVRETHLQLELQIEEIEKRIEERNSKIQSSLRNKQKNQALSYLRSRKQLEELLDKRMGARETLHGVVVKIEQAQGDVEIMKAYELSSTTLKNLLSKPELQSERVENTMNNLSETLADYSEINDAIQMGGDLARQSAGEGEIDDQELEEEMKKLELEQEMEKKEMEMAVKVKEREREEKEEHSKQQERAKERQMQEEEQKKKREADQKNQREESQRLEGEREHQSRIQEQTEREKQLAE